jgi:hypothetical protein
VPVRKLLNVTVYVLDIYPSSWQEGNVSQRLQGPGFPGSGLVFRGYGNTTLPPSSSEINEYFDTDK